MPPKTNSISRSKSQRNAPRLMPNPKYDTKAKGIDAGQATKGATRNTRTKTKRNRSRNRKGSVRQAELYIHIA